MGLTWLEQYNPLSRPSPAETKDDGLASLGQALDTSDVAFGRAVQGLPFRRRTIAADLLWSPLPTGW